MNRQVPTLETERLVIRELTMADLESIHSILNKAFDQEVPVSERQRWLQ